MPPIDHLNPPPNPFWDFVADMRDHPFFAAYAPQDRPHQRSEQTQARGEPTTAEGDTNTQQHPQEKQANVEDPPEVDPATLNEQASANEAREGPWARGRRRRGSSPEDGGERRRGCPGRRGGWGNRHGGPRGFGGGPGACGPSFPFGGPPFWMRGGGPGPHHHHPPPPPPPGFGPGPGFQGRGGFHRRGGPPHHPHPHPHGPPPHHHGPHHRGPSPPPPPSPPTDFNLTQFLTDLGSAIGLDLNGAAQGAGLTRFMSGYNQVSNPEVDFEPKADIFDQPTTYIVHVSLPGAKKSDIGVDWDGEHSALHVAGVVYRPDVDEKMMETLAVDGRKREVGMFEKKIRLGTRRDPAVVRVDAIKARMVDGVLIVTVPKAEKNDRRHEVPIEKSVTPSPVREVRDHEKQVVFDADREMVDVDAEHPRKETPDHEINLIDLTRDNNSVSEPEKSEKAKGKEAEVQRERERERERSATVEADEPEQLPAYNPVDHHQHDGSDWENFGSDEEGEYVKINVD